MAFTSNQGKGPMAEINVTPLVDVMLVLLIIFMITAPILAHQVEIDLPQKSNVVNLIEPPPPIVLKIRSTGELYWNEQPMISAALEPQLKIEAAKDPQPELQIDADLETPYETVAAVLATAKNVGMTKLGFKNMSGTGS
ncbi:MAG TPA: biopolymer transporter ExbD [Xanthomonadales bacterium]|nr:biopolymer transporter ExbD [Xanthomonadales bacterium]